MVNAIGEAKRGLAAALASIEGLRVYDYEPDGVHEFPAAIVRLESREPVETLGDGAVRGNMRVEVLVPATDAQQADDVLGAFLEPQGAQSIEAAVTADRTWGGAVDRWAVGTGGQGWEAEGGRGTVPGGGFLLLVCAEWVGLSDSLQLV